MLTIQSITAFSATSGGYVEDMMAIKGIGQRLPETKRPGSVLSFVLQHSGGTAYGDGMSVQYSAACGRSAAFDARECQEDVLRSATQLLVGRRLRSFRAASKLLEDGLGSKPWATPVAFGLSQALLMAFAQTAGITITRLIRDEYDIRGEPHRPLVLAQTDSHSLSVIDRMIMKGADIFPHANFVHPRQLGPKGEDFLKYVDGVCEKVARYRSSAYAKSSTLHFDLYGTLGQLFDENPKAVAQFIADLEKRVYPLALQIETPVLGTDRSSHYRAFKEIRQWLRHFGSSTQLIVDEWCNTLDDVRDALANDVADIFHIKMPDLGSIHNCIEAVLACRQAGAKAYLGGSSNETEISAQVSAEVAIATGPYQCLAKPGMGVDEGMMVTCNGLERALLLASTPRRTKTETNAYVGGDYVGNHTD